MTDPPGQDQQSRRWREAMALVDGLLELPEGGREAALREAAVEPEVRALARRMLQAAERPSVLDSPLPPLADVEEPAAASLVGRRLGRWLLTDLLGEGGMSVVCRARSLEPPLGQEAAVKLLSLAAATAAGRARFEREIDILVKLRHPGIAPVFDAGVADDGTPWFAMALVEGVDIESWCERRGLGAAARVDLLLQVCDAVEHAHRHLVIHRDIKPSNVLVDGEGRAILLDFGISRLLEEGAAEATGSGQYAFTPRYAAPEQLQGGAITTATDVYSLGSLLHKLLLGVPPRFPANAPGAECADPAALAKKDGDRALRRQLSGDLGAILRKSLARDPARRYAGAAGFAADLRAWRQGLPVAAQRDGALYRIGKFVSRHKLASGLTAALLLSLVAGVAGFAWQARQARAEAERAALTREFLLDVFAEADVVGRGNRAPDMRTVLEKAAELAPRRFADRADLQAEVLRLVGRLQRLNMDNHAAAKTLRAALALDESNDAPWTDERRRTARQLSVALRLLGEPKEAAAVTQAWMAADPDSAKLTSAFHCVGLLDLKYENLQARRAGYEKALPRCLSFPAGDRQRLLFVSRLATVRRQDGDAQGAFDLASAEDAALSALPSLPLGAWSEWSVLKAELAQSLSALERRDEAAEAAAAGVHLAEENAGADSAFVVGPLRVLGGRLRDAERFDEARQALERALSVNRALGEGRVRGEDASILLDLGSTFFAQGEHAAAAERYEQALAAYAEAGIVANVDIGTTLRLLSESRWNLRQYGQAAEAAKRALDFHESQHPNRNDLRAKALFRLCLALAGQGDRGALAHCEEGIELDRQREPEDAELTAAGREYLAEAERLLRH